jgi:hypothetical protein
LDLYYNPERMKEFEIKETFVAHDWLVSEILSLIKREPSGAGAQHLLLLGPRGIGKTTILLMLQFGIRESQLKRRFLAVRFPEESYGITDLADFWLAAIMLVAAEMDDDQLNSAIGELKEQFTDADTLADAAVAVLKDWGRKNGRRIVLLVDNFDMILDQINDVEGNARLRAVLMNDGNFILVGTATSFFKEVRGYDQPLYNFFKNYDLNALSEPEVNSLLRKRARIEGIDDFDERLEHNQPRIQVLYYFTGGNPRLVLMLYRIITASGFGEVKQGLEKLLDEVTPYYKAKLESLPPQQRKIIDQIARISGRTHEGVTPTEIARNARLSVNQTTAQLKRLIDLGYVRVANNKSRHAYYILAEPLYAIWHQMRFARENRRRVEWLVDFLRGWYSSGELADQATALAASFRDLQGEGKKGPALDVLELRTLLTSALGGDFIGGPGDQLIRDCLDNGKLDEARQVLKDTGLISLHPNTVQRLTERGLTTAEQVQAFSVRNDSLSGDIERVTSLLEAKDWGNALPILDRIRPLFRLDPVFRHCRGIVLLKLGRMNDALPELTEARSLNPNMEFLTLLFLKAFDQARMAWQGVIARAGVNWETYIMAGIRALAEPDNLEFLRSLLKESQTEDRLFPAARALDYLITRDRSCLERLSADVRPIVEVIVSEYEQRHAADPLRYLNEKSMPHEV